MKLYDEIYKLKTILREGWKIRNISSKEGRVESDAEHTFSTIILALEIMNKEKFKLDQLKVLKMIAYHELGEIDYGDHTPFENISKEEKFVKKIDKLDAIIQSRIYSEINNSSELFSAFSSSKKDVYNEFKDYI